ncbi:MAG: PDZ domain-containing protein, partial [Nitrospinae bacterium]|nr:PDZ domain-containing protein [Nitrospinota bacterium]
MIDPGSSGGPLVNLNGEVIGINSMSQGRGIGFTIPINTAMDIKNRFLEEGRVERGWLGITMQPLSRDLAGYMNMPDQNGVIVNSVMDDSPASAAGLKSGDIITAFDGQVIESENEGDLKNFQRLIGQTEIDRNIKIEIIRDSKKRELYAKIKKQPKTELKEIESEFGFNVTEITNDIYLANRKKKKKGVFITFVEPGSVA